MKLPGEDHPITIEAHRGRIVIRFGDAIVAETTRALTLKEGSYPPVLYIPRADAKLEHFERSAHRSFCPYKGEASYFHLKSGDTRAENAVWSYETPFPAMAEIEKRLAFYPNKARITLE
ncbi:MAG: DUF427 domain-containing protein [Alphaproteobacteria bacterium]|nr:DUF427 domain-containing protein [Alphaproteobacteria bacterium]